MATSRGQRIGIWIAAIAMTVGTIGGFIAMMVAPQNEAREQAEQQQFQRDYEQYQEDRTKEADELSSRYLSLYKQYETTPAKFTAADVKKISTRDLKEGDGAVINDDTKFAAYYIGWNPDGKVFDQSLKEGKLSEPLYRSSEMSGMTGLDKGLAQANVVDGWKKGLKGMKIGGVREITIPSDLAYGEAGSGEDIPPNTPLKFIVMAIPPLKDLKEPVIPEALLQQAAEQEEMQ